jgi:hypothetical protein
MTSESDKNIRLSVLRMAVSMCDHEHMVAQEIEREAKPKLRTHTPYPTDEEVIAKAKKLMMFVDETPAKISQEFLTENQVRSSEDL